MGAVLLNILSTGSLHDYISIPSAYVCFHMCFKTVLHAFLCMLRIFYDCFYAFLVSF